MWRLVLDCTKNNDKVLNPMHLHDRFNISRLLLHPDNHSFIHILEIALALIYQDGFVSVWTNDTSQVTWWKLMNHFIIV